MPNQKNFHSAPSGQNRDYTREISELTGIPANSIGSTILRPLDKQ